MKKVFLLFTFFFTFFALAQVSWQAGTNPEANQSGTILFNKTGTGLASYSGTIYAHTGVTLNGAAWQNVIGTWGNNTQQPVLTLVSGTTYKLDLNPSILAYYGVGSGDVTKINIVFRSASGTQQTTNLELNVGSFQANVTAPVENGTTILTSGQNLAITANATLAATFNLYRNGTLLNSNTGTSYSYTHFNITANGNYDLQITDGTVNFSKKFYVIVNPNTPNGTIPNALEDGINYNPTDNTKAVLVLDAPNKDFVYVAGSFNNWQPDATYAMKKDPGSTKFWLELSGLTPGQDYTYQYWVVDQTPITNSPALVKTADPYSTMVLSPFDDPFIPATSYPNIPAYPTGQEREVTVLKTGQTPYNWSAATTNFVKPNKDNLVVYEVLIRDFDANRNFQDLINKIDYFKNLNINAIQLMPIMEFEGNESWGYNTSFHLALDKFYGTSDKCKEFIDLCHQNGIAVILDVALNHAFGRNPMDRMWMNDPDGDGWGAPSSENPYFNQIATHSYSVGNDFNHQQARTKYFVKRVVKHWIEEYKIDGFRWDLTKGFTQNATGSDTQTNALQQDRIDVLKEYADYSWSLDPTHYVIFEHLGVGGSASEETVFANYKFNEGKGIMLWGELHQAYKQLTLGYTAGADISGMGHVSRGFSGKRLLGYPESHDKDRLAYEAVAFGNNGGTSPVGGNLTNTLNRMSAIGATSILIPGPKMVWHFQELGMDDSIYTCNNGSVNTETDATAGNCKLDTKPQPQWVENWMGNATRSSIYQNYSKFIELKTTQPVFNGNYAISPDGNNLKQRIYVFENTFATSQLRNVVVIANFNTSVSLINPSFPTDVYTYPMIWYDLMTNNTVTINSATDLISLNPGEFRVFGNQPTVLGNDIFNLETQLKLYPNPANDTFVVNTDAKEIAIYNLAGQLVKSFKNTLSNNFLTVSDLNSGIYLVKVTDTNNNQAAKKFIKQ